ncbi:MAG: GNAT family protein [Patulibacter minatonensis]
MTSSPRPLRDLSTYVAPAPQPVSLAGRYVELEPWDRATHLLALWEALGGEGGLNELIRFFPVEDYDAPDGFGDMLDEQNADAGWITLVARATATSEVVGMASYMRADPANGVVEVGAVAHGPAMARTPLATELHFLMARHAFEELGYRRYEWKCDDRNEASRAAAERYGFTYEGVFRQHMVSRGRNRDTAWFAMIDADWPAIGGAFEAWLDPANFDADGGQLRRLEEFRAAP